MQNTVRTTVRIRKDLMDQSRLLAAKHGVSLQGVINNTLAKGFGHISDIEIRREALKKIEKFRKSLLHKKINVQELVAQNKKELETRTNNLLKQASGR